MKSFRQILTKADNILILTGSGLSAESGVPTFRGSGGFWRKYQAQALATPEAFRSNPSLVWEFYEYRRKLVSQVQPNKAHQAIANFQNRSINQGKRVTILTQNVDELHQRANAQNVIELHGSLYRTRCTVCANIAVDRSIPICPALAGKGSPDLNAISADIPLDDLPHCKFPNCRGLLRPDIVWFGENLSQHVLEKAFDAVENCDVCLLIGTSSVVYPAAMLAPRVASRGIPVAEFNLESTPGTKYFQYYFEGPCTTTVPQALEDI